MNCLTGWRPWTPQEVEDNKIGEEVRFKDNQSVFGVILSVRKRDNAVLVFWQHTKVIAVTDVHQLFDLCTLRRSDTGEDLPCGTYQPIP